MKLDYEAIFDKCLLVFFYCGLVCFILLAKSDHDTTMWLREGAAGILGALLALIKGGQRQVNNQNDIRNSTVNQPTDQIPTVQPPTA